MPLRSNLPNRRLNRGWRPLNRTESTKYLKGEPISGKCVVFR